MNNSDLKTTMPDEPISNLLGQSSENDVSKTNAAKKKTRKKKPKNDVAKGNSVEVTPALCATVAENLPVEHCTTALQSSEVARNSSSVSQEPVEACSQPSPQKSVRKRGKKSSVKCDKSTNVENDCTSLFNRGESNQKLPGASSTSSPRNKNLREKKRTVSHGPDSNAPDLSKIDCNKIKKEDGRTFARGNRSLSVDEDSFEEYMPPNVVEGLLQLPNYLKGTIRINQKMYTEAYIAEPTGKRDILIEGIRNRNRALEGDEVVVAILPRSEWKQIEPNEMQQTGKVIYLMKAIHLRQAIGILKPMPQKGSLQALFSPRDSRIPRMRIPITECPPDFEKNGDDLYVARITTWDNVRFARGNLLGGSFGVQGDIDAETTAILQENGIRSVPYPSHMIPHFPAKLQQQDFKNREDLRKKCIFSIDPITARDLDDALSCEVLENGNYLIGVHISDVSYYLEEGSPLDELVAETATSTYLVQSVYHMLPREMTMNCSLLPGEDKLSFSVIWELEETDTEVKVISHRFTRSVMNSCAQLAYEHAQTMLENPDKKWDPSELPKIYNGYTPEDLSKIVCTLNRLAIKLRSARFENGSLRIDQTKLFFNLDENGLPVGMAAYENKESHRLIEEFMLLANIAVATALHKAYPSIAFLRQHSAPRSVLMDKLREQLEVSGIIIDTSSAKGLQQSLETYRDNSSVEGVARSIALNSLFSKPMARAKYFCLARAASDEDVRHFALSVPIYTHFTSPIRRYADVMVHRLLAALLGYSPAPQWTEKFVAKVAANCNMRKFNAKKAGEQSSEVFLALHLRTNGPLDGYGVVVDVKDRSFDVIFCSTGTIGRIYVDKIGAQAEKVQKQGKFSYNLTWFTSEDCKPVQQVVALFSIVNVQLKCCTNSKLQIETVLLPPWDEPSPANGGIDLSSLKLPDILDDVQECLYTSDDDLSSPESVCESPTPPDEKHLENITLVSARRL